MHKQKTVALKQESIDEHIVSIIEWLNSFESIITWYSCQGNKKYGYVIFSCHDQMELLQICRAINPEAWPDLLPPLYVTIEAYPDIAFRYKLVFPGGVEQVKKFAGSI